MRGYYSFAFLRHPCDRTFSCYADKHVRLVGRGDRVAAADFIEPFHGVRKGMSFLEFCRWLATPYGSDAFANRHWVSQRCHVTFPDGRLPDFIGFYERLDADWRTVCMRLGLPETRLGHLNSRPRALVPSEHLTDEAITLLTRRYAEDFRLGGYDA